MPVTVLLTVAGDHVPVIPFVEVVGRTGAAVPLHIGPAGLKAGTIPPSVTVTVSVAFVAHCPAVGVKGYVVDAGLLTVSGAQVPVLSFVELYWSLR